MNYIYLFFCLPYLTLAVREKQINLEDIEKDNLASERVTQKQLGPIKEEFPGLHQYITPPHSSFKAQHHYQPQFSLPQLQQYQQFQRVPQIHPQPTVASIPKLPTSPRLQFGFKPMKTAQHGNPTSPQTQQYNYANFPTPPEAFTYQQPQQIQHLPPSKAQQYVQNNPQYQQYDLNYLTNNHLTGQDSNLYQQYYTPQLFYIQQYPAASTSFQTVVDPKGGIQYVMYVPSQYPQETKQIQTAASDILQSQQEQQFYTTPDPGLQQYQYVTVPTVSQPPPQKFADIQYVVPQQEQSSDVTQKHQKYEPKSLLDSYVPSLVQLQYLKQHQQQGQGNSIQAHLKPPQSPQKQNGPHLQNYNVPLHHHPYSRHTSTRLHVMKQ